MMRGQFAINARKARFDEILNSLKILSKQGKVCSYSRLCAEIGVSMGLTERKVAEYMAQLQLSERILINKEQNTVMLNGSTDS